MESERGRMGLWWPVGLGAGIAAWFALPATMHWIGLLLLLASGILGGLLIGWDRRLGRVMTVGCGAVAIGLLLVWARALGVAAPRSEEHTSELQSLMRISYAVFCLKKKKK